MGKRTKILRGIAYFVLILALAAPLGFSAYTTVQNRRLIGFLQKDLSSLDTGARSAFLATAAALQTHKTALETFEQELIAQKEELKNEKALTEALVMYYDEVLANIRKEIGHINRRLDRIERDICALEEYDGGYAARKLAQHDLYNDGLKVSVFIWVEYYDEKDPTPVRDEDGNAKPFVAASGSGTFIQVLNGKTYVLTAAHVVDDFVRQAWERDPDTGAYRQTERKIPPTITIRSYHVDEKVIDNYRAKVVAFDSEKDLALLVIDDFEAETVASVIGKDEIKDISLHDDVYVIGCPLGVTPRVSPGSVTAWIHAQEGYIESDCDLIWGNSGGAMFRNGKVIGVVSRGRIGNFQMVESLGLCVSPSVIHEFLDTNTKAFE